jgi:hypothetical protein
VHADGFFIISSSNKAALKQALLLLVQVLALVGIVPPGISIGIPIEALLLPKNLAKLLEDNCLRHCFKGRARKLFPARLLFELNI